MKSIVFLLLVVSTTSVMAQYYLFETTLTCKSENRALVEGGHEKITSILNLLKNEGKVLNFSTQLSNNKKGAFVLAYSSTAQNADEFKRFADAWKKRTIDLDQVYFESFWKACNVRRDTLGNKTQLMYPYIKGDINAPVAVVEGIDEKPDPSLTYNMVFDFTAFQEMEGRKFKMDSSMVNAGLSDLARIFNLHIAAGIPKERINFVVAIHGGNATRSFFNNEAYQKRYKINNPSLPLIEELSNAGVKFLVCGQSLTWLGYNKTMLSPKTKVTLTAQTTLSSYQVKGYALKTMSND
jgi:intracellular sulfur oxidation DsrE/DsrF family protein